MLRKESCGTSLKFPLRFWLVHRFFHGKKPAFMRTIKPTFLTLVFFVPLALLAAGMNAPPLLFVAFISQYIGLLAERWFFFAQAYHPQNLYYQGIS